MSENGHEPARGLSELLLAGIGWASLGVEAVDQLADDVARRVGVERDEMRSALRETVGAWKRDAQNLGAKGDETVDRALAKVGLARREELEDLTLRIAQLEHRLRLLERDADSATASPSH
jgi:polyhydroxyalkanoate synthesis regulator phasin